MIQNNNISVLPWYTSINEQNHRKSYAYGAIYPLFAPANRLLPFKLSEIHVQTSLSLFCYMIKTKNELPTLQDL